MLFHHENLIKKEGSLVLGKDVTAKANAVLDKPVLKEFWHGHTFHSSCLQMTHVPETVFFTGNITLPPLEHYAYVIRVTPEGIGIAAGDEKNLLYGYMTLLDLIEIHPATGSLEIPCCEIRERPLVKNRMVHFCVFPETKLWELHKFVRLCGALKYSHLVLEFWGMLQYDCMKELAWPHAFTKEQIKPILQEAQDTGLEIIPMFNHWGHATACRLIHGKHVVLDQNPSLYPLFSDDGWCWRVEREEVRALLKQIRHELTELCGEGSYFHIGCDEAYGFTHTKDRMEAICQFLNETGRELASEGRTAIMWGDMLLHRHEEFQKDNAYSAACPDKESEAYMLSHLDKNLLIADWQYWCDHYPIETALTLKDAGFSVLVCPWDQGLSRSDACMETVKRHELSGLMHTTWHTLSTGMPYVARTAAACWDSASINGDMTSYCVKTAALLRKVYFVGGSYEKAGWARYEISTLT